MSSKKDLKTNIGIFDYNSISFHDNQSQLSNDDPPPPFPHDTEITFLNVGLRSMWGHLANPNDYDSPERLGLPHTGAKLERWNL